MTMQEVQGLIEKRLKHPSGVVGLQAELLIIKQMLHQRAADLRLHLQFQNTGGGQDCGTQQHEASSLLPVLNVHLLTASASQALGKLPSISVVCKDVSVATHDARQPSRGTSRRAVDGSTTVPKATHPSEPSRISLENGSTGIAAVPVGTPKPILLGGVCNVNSIVQTLGLPAPSRVNVDASCDGGGRTRLKQLERTCPPEKDAGFGAAGSKEVATFRCHTSAEAKARMCSLNLMPVQPLVTPCTDGNAVWPPAPRQLQVQPGAQHKLATVNAVTVLDVTALDGPNAEARQQTSRPVLGASQPYVQVAPGMALPCQQQLHHLVQQQQQYLQRQRRRWRWQQREVRANITPPAAHNGPHLSLGQAPPEVGLLGHESTGQQHSTTAPHAQAGMDLDCDDLACKLSPLSRGVAHHPAASETKAVGAETCTSTAGASPSASQSSARSKSHAGGAGVDVVPGTPSVMGVGDLASPQQRTLLTFEPSTSIDYSPEPCLCHSSQLDDDAQQERTSESAIAGTPTPSASPLPGQRRPRQEEVERESSEGDHPIGHDAVLSESSLAEGCVLPNGKACSIWEVQLPHPVCVLSASSDGRHIACIMQPAEQERQRQHLPLQRRRLSQPCQGSAPALTSYIMLVWSTTSGGPKLEGSAQLQGSLADITAGPDPSGQDGALYTSIALATADTPTVVTTGSLVMPSLPDDALPRAVSDAKAHIAVRVLQLQDGHWHVLRLLLAPACMLCLTLTDDGRVVAAGESGQAHTWQLGSCQLTDDTDACNDEMRNCAVIDTGDALPPSIYKGIAMPVTKLVSWPAGLLHRPLVAGLSAEGFVAIWDIAAGVLLTVLVNIYEAVWLMQPLASMDDGVSSLADDRARQCLHHHDSDAMFKAGARDLDQHPLAMLAVVQKKGDLRFQEDPNRPRHLTSILLWQNVMSVGGPLQGHHDSTIGPQQCFSSRDGEGMQPCTLSAWGVNTAAGFASGHVIVWNAVTGRMLQALVCGAPIVGVAMAGPHTVYAAAGKSLVTCTWYDDSAQLL